MKILVLVLAVLGCIYNLVLNIVEMRSTGNKTPQNVAIFMIMKPMQNGRNTARNTVGSV